MTEERKVLMVVYISLLLLIVSCIVGNIRNNSSNQEEILINKKLREKLNIPPVDDEFYSDLHFSVVESNNKKLIKNFVGIEEKSKEE